MSGAPVTGNRRFQYRPGSVSRAAKSDAASKIARALRLGEQRLVEVATLWVQQHRQIDALKIRLVDNSANAGSRCKRMDFSKVAFEPRARVITQPRDGLDDRIGVLFFWCARGEFKRRSGALEIFGK